jgi:hypothetical protein
MMENRLQQIEDEQDKCCLTGKHDFENIAFRNEIGRLTDKLYAQMRKSSKLDILIKYNLEELKHAKFMEES